MTDTTRMHEVMNPRVLTRTLTLTLTSRPIMTDTTRMHEVMKPSNRPELRSLSHFLLSAIHCFSNSEAAFGSGGICSAKAW